MCTFNKTLSKLDHNLSNLERQRARLIHLFLAQGKNYNELGGKKLTCAPELIRFKLGRCWRLIYRKKKGTLCFEAVIPRKKLDQFLRHSCSSRRR